MSMSVLCIPPTYVNAIPPTNVAVFDNNGHPDMARLQKENQVQSSLNVLPH